MTRRGVLLAGLLGPVAWLLASRSEAAAAMPHIVLLGDSTLDNAAYVARGEAVEHKLRAVMPKGWTATLLAVDGAVTSGVASQLRRLPGDATHLVVSVGGNDALGYTSVLQERASSVAEALQRLSEVRGRFAADYREMLDGVVARRLPTAISTIYDPNHSDAQFRTVGGTALTVLNDVITREAARRGVPLIDLRTMFSDPGDYANAIEPSGQGGGKIATAIRDLVSSHDFGRRRSEIFTTP